MVPSSAVVEHEQAKFVFVSESGGHFRRQDVRIGLTQDDWTEVISGLTEGVTVVTHGAFVLKSELLLERE